MPAYAMTAEEMVASVVPSSPQARELKKRGINVYTMSELWGVVGRGRKGNLMQGLIERPLFGLTGEERIELCRNCSPIFGMVMARMNRIAALDWEIEKDSKAEDRLESRLKMWKSLADEYKAAEPEVQMPEPGMEAQMQMPGMEVPQAMPQPAPPSMEDLQAAAIRRRVYVHMKGVLVELKPDFSNFGNCLIRWRKRIRERTDDKSIEIQDWLQTPNIHDDYDDMIKKMVQDLMVHGSFALYKKKDPETKLLENFFALPGGTVLPMRSRYVGGPGAFFQMIPSIEPKVYFQDEIVYKSYCPSTALSYGMIPLESLVNKLAETLFFDQLAAMRADGMQPPDKVVLFGEKAPFGELTAGGGDFDMPIAKDEQSRIETIINEPRKYAIRVLSGYGTPAVLDLSKADTFGNQQERQRDSRAELARVYNMSNLEVNLTGSEDTSGRATSESQERIEREKGIYPIVKLVETVFNRNIIPYRWGSDYHIKYKSGLSEQEELELDTKKVMSKTYAVNQVRMERGDEPYPEEKYDRPEGGEVQQPDGSEVSPFNMKMTEGMGG